MPTRRPAAPPRPRLVRDTLHVGRHFSVHFPRTLRIPDDGREWPLPPGFGPFPLRRVEDYLDTVPDAWREAGGFFLPIHQREALWLSFGGDDWHPVAVQVGAGAVNAISGEAWDGVLRDGPVQDYLVVPEQPWLDGINAGHGFIRQFVATPLGSGASIEAQLTGTETGGIRIAVVEPVPGRFPDEPPAMPRFEGHGDGICAMACASAAPMGLAAGGRMRQSIYPDAHGLATWDQSRVRVVHVHMADARTWHAVTGEAPPPSPVTAESYLRAGLPWFALYDEHKGDVRPPARLRGVKSLAELDAEQGTFDPANLPLKIVG